MNNNFNFSQYDRYLKTFKKYGIDPAEIVAFFENGGKITEVHELYEKNENCVTFPKQPKERKVSEVTAENYLNVCTWIHCYMGFERVERKRTLCGTIPVRMISIRPDGNAKSITHFTFTK